MCRAFDVWSMDPGWDGSASCVLKAKECQLQRSPAANNTQGGIVCLSSAPPNNDPQTPVLTGVLSLKAREIHVVGAVSLNPLPDLGAQASGTTMASLVGLFDVTLAGEPHRESRHRTRTLR